MGAQIRPLIPESSDKYREMTLYWDDIVHTYGGRFITTFQLKRSERFFD